MEIIFLGHLILVFYKIYNNLDMSVIELGCFMSKSIKISEYQFSS